LKPAKLDDLLTVETRPEGLGGARLELAQAVKRDTETIAAARVTVVAVGADGRPCRVPETARAALAPLLAVTG
ncbi:hypothetical protein J8J40_31680, partial [Mycobacterium tuberculosis]|nr:hypothetical protein [Mycobacterium tuberculosis]